jgi:hypothetical protein
LAAVDCSSGGTVLLFAAGVNATLGVGVVVGASVKGYCKTGDFSVASIAVVGFSVARGEVVANSSISAFIIGWRLPFSVI